MKKKEIFKVLFIGKSSRQHERLSSWRAASHVQDNLKNWKIFLDSRIITMEGVW